MREFVLQDQKEMARAQEIIPAPRWSIHVREEEVDRLKPEAEASEKRLKELEKAVRLLQTAHERNWEMAAH